MVIFVLILHLLITQDVVKHIQQKMENVKNVPLVFHSSMVNVTKSKLLDAYKNLIQDLAPIAHLALVFMEEDALELLRDANNT